MANGTHTIDIIPNPKWYQSVPTAVVGSVTNETKRVIHQNTHPPTTLNRRASKGLMIITNLHVAVSCDEGVGVLYEEENLARFHSRAAATACAWACVPRRPSAIPTVGCFL